jgi:hypothetical protein
VEAEILKTLGESGVPGEARREGGLTILREKGQVKCGQEAHTNGSGVLLMHLYTP